MNASTESAASGSAPDPLAAPPADAAHADNRKLAVAALGVIFGDIGTSPLYTVREAFSPAAGIPLTPQSLMSVLSLIFWSVTIIVSRK